MGEAAGVSGDGVPPSLGLSRTSVTAPSEDEFDLEQTRRPAHPRNRHRRASGAVILHDEGGASVFGGPRRWEAAFRNRGDHNASLVPVEHPVVAMTIPDAAQMVALI
jgi:hypothetical protein